MRSNGDSLVRDGYVVLDRVLGPEAIAILAAALDVPGGSPDRRQRVGDRRFVLSIELAGAFADPAVLANRSVVHMIREILGPDAVLEWIGAEMVMPGAGPQHIQRDGGPLFDSTMSPLLPAHALALELPLTSYDVALWPKSHRWKARDESVAPVVVALTGGSCLLRDVRLFHGGSANPSGEPRMALQATYARRWYRDAGDLLRGFRAPLAPSDAFLANLGDDDRRLFAHVEPVVPSMGLRS